MKFAREQGSKVLAEFIMELASLRVRLFLFSVCFCISLFLYFHRVSTHQILFF